MKESDAERALATLLKWEKLPEPIREHRFAEPRRWRFDFAWQKPMVAVEVEGGIYSGGGHTRGAYYEAECEKLNEAALLGWMVLRVTPRHIDSGEAIAWIKRALT